MAFTFGPRRGTYVDITEVTPTGGPLDVDELAHFERSRPRLPFAVRHPLQLRAHLRPSRRLDLLGPLRRRHPLSTLRTTTSAPRTARTPTSSPTPPATRRWVSTRCGRCATSWRASARRSCCPPDVEQRLRLEDLLGFRRNPITDTPLFRRFGAKALDGHPTPATPFVRLATGASGVGVASSIGLALRCSRPLRRRRAARPHRRGRGWADARPRCRGACRGRHRLASATSILHLDWNQASIDSEHVCRDGDVPGDYVQWDPRELFYLHDWNVIDVPDGFDFQQVIAAQRHALTLTDGQPTAIVYRTVKGWRYGVEGRASPRRRPQALLRGLLRGARGTDGRRAGRSSRFRRCDASDPRCRRGDEGPAEREACFWEALEVLRTLLERDAAARRGHGRSAAGGARTSRGPRPRAAPWRARHRGHLRRRRAIRGRGPRRAAPRAGHVHHAARRARPRARPPKLYLGRRRAHRLGRPARLDQRRHGRRGLSRAASGTRT